MTGLFRQEAIDNKRERLWGDVVLIQPLSFYLVTGIITVIVISAVIFLVYGTYARRENVSGYLLPDKGLVKIYGTGAGLVSQVHVDEGEQVKQGDLLFTITTRKNNAKSTDVDALVLKQLKQNKITTEKKITKQRLLNKREKTQFKDQIAGLKIEVRQLKTLIKTHKKKYKVSQEHLKRIKKLYAKKYLSKADFITAQEHHADIQLGLNEARQQLSSKKNQLAESSNQLNQHPLQASIQLAEFTQQLSNIKQQIVESKGRRTYSLQAPSDGRVTAIQVSKGHTVQDQPLLTILPDEAKYQAELFIPTRAIGFIKIGQPVLLRYSAFPYQRFGLYKGTVNKVTEVILSPDEMHVPVTLEEPVYRVSVTPEKQTIFAYNREFNLQAGMLLEASIILEGRSLGQWLLEPIYSLKGRF